MCSSSLEQAQCLWRVLSPNRSAGRAVAVAHSPLSGNSWKISVGGVPYPLEEGLRRLKVEARVIRAALELGLAGLVRFPRGERAVVVAASGGRRAVFDPQSNTGQP